MALVFLGMLTGTNRNGMRRWYERWGICSHDNVPYAGAAGMGVMGTVNQQDATVQVLLKRMTRSMSVKYLKKSLSAMTVSIHPCQCHLVLTFHNKLPIVSE